MHKAKKGRKALGDLPAVVLTPPLDAALKALAAADMAAWAGHGLYPPLVGALAAQGFTTPTAVQEACLPAAVHGRRDIIGAAQTVRRLVRCCFPCCGQVWEVAYALGRSSQEAGSVYRTSCGPLVATSSVRRKQCLLASPELAAGQAAVGSARTASSFGARRASRGAVVRGGSLRAPRPTSRDSDRWIHGTVAAPCASRAQDLPRRSPIATTSCRAVLVPTAQ